MADNDYTVRGESGLTTVAFLVADIGHMENSISITGLKVTDPTATAIGRPAMIDNEIVRVDAVTGDTVTVSRGCADTIPAAHLAGAPVWFFDMEMGTDRREYLVGETISVKPLVHTPNSIHMAVSSVPPRQLTFNQRFNRPYPPGEFKCKGDYWFTGVKTLPVGTTELVWTWNHRDRLLQADQLIDHNDGDIGPELGTTYTARVYTSANVLVRTVAGIAGKTWSYPRSDAMVDLPGGVGYIVICSVRGGLESLYSYRTDILWDDSAPQTDPNFANVSLLLHMDGPHGSQIIEDSSLLNKSVSAYNNAVLSTVAYKFGGSSAYFDGTGDYFTYIASSELSFGTSDFTIELWVNPDDFLNVGGLIGKFNTWANNVDFFIWISSNTGTVNCGFGNSVPAGIASDIGLTPNIWTHLVVTRSAGVFMMFINGIKQISTSSVVVNIQNQQPTVTIGSGAPNVFQYKGYIDELRITKDVARYTVDFTPPTTPHPDA